MQPTNGRKSSWRAAMVLQHREPHKTTRTLQHIYLTFRWRLILTTPPVFTSSPPHARTATLPSADSCLLIAALRLLSSHHILHKGSVCLVFSSEKGRAERVTDVWRDDHDHRDDQQGTSVCAQNL
ncbi:hypothetical protein FQA47_013282 [Oryzias melastigma]|uniref:Uncharacterized protein n=1 Tax=Oryzias melastigma TaxID=30732 RepID=A0A834BXU1_ORYME|nr:hypothetical protein FQA47_013282 [Oryzias melastigma]